MYRESWEYSRYRYITGYEKQKSPINMIRDVAKGGGVSVGGSHPHIFHLSAFRQISSANFIGDPAKGKNKNSLAQEVRQKRDISERRSKD